MATDHAAATAVALVPDSACWAPADAGQAIQGSRAGCATGTAVVAVAQCSIRVATGAARADAACSTGRVSAECAVHADVPAGAAVVVEVVAARALADPVAAGLAVQTGVAARAAVAVVAKHSAGASCRSATRLIRLGHDVGFRVKGLGFRVQGLGQPLTTSSRLLLTHHIHGHCQAILFHCNDVLILPTRTALMCVGQGHEMPFQTGKICQWKMRTFTAHPAVSCVCASLLGWASLTAGAAVIAVAQISRSAGAVVVISRSSTITEASFAIGASRPTLATVVAVSQNSTGAACGDRSVGLGFITFRA